VTQVASRQTSLPQAGIYDIDPAHTNVEFVARHVVSKVRGRFTDFSGTIEIADDPLESAATATITTASVETFEERRNNHLKSDDFFGSDRWPHITFESKSIRPAGDGRFELTGELTVRDVTRAIVLDVEYLGAAKDPWGNDRIAFSAATQVNREEFGLTWNAVIETGGVLVGRDVRLELEVAAVRRADS
jgi:polyisoprenoid-binding protein YceI